MNNAAANTNPSQTMTAKILPAEISTKWDKISAQEATAMKAKGDLVSQVQAKYGVNREQAQKDVDSWANGRDF